MKFKKLVALLLALCLCGACLPFSAAAASLPFKDVKAGDWFFEDVSYVYRKGLFSGTTKTTFAPNSYMDRGMVATALYKQAKSPKVSGYTLFSDLSSKSYYKNAVLWADSRGIVNGTSETKFSPASKVTREQLAALFYRYAVLYVGVDGYAGDVDLNDFQDGWQVSSYAEKAMRWCVSKKIITGKNGGTILDPAGKATRAQVAAMLRRFGELPQEQGTGYQSTLDPLLKNSTGAFNRSLYYDLDGDGQEELLTAYGSKLNDFPCEVASVYTISGGEVVPLLTEESMFTLAGGPSGRIGAVEQNGEILACVFLESGGTGGESFRRNGTYKFYRLLGTELEKAAECNYQVNYIHDKPQSASDTAVLTEYGAERTLSYFEFQNWVNSINWKARVYVTA